MNTIENILNSVKALIVSVAKRLQAEPILVRTGLALIVSLKLVNLTDVQVDTIDQLVLAVLVLTGSATARNLVNPMTSEEIKKQKEIKTVKKQKNKIEKAQNKIQKTRAKTKKATPRKRSTTRKKGSK